jgi:hypothetical protein
MHTRHLTSTYRKHVCCPRQATRDDIAEAKYIRRELLTYGVIAGTFVMHLPCVLSCL